MTDSYTIVQILRKYAEVGLKPVATLRGLDSMQIEHVEELLKLDNDEVAHLALDAIAEHVVENGIILEKKQSPMQEKATQILRDAGFKDVFASVGPNKVVLDSNSKKSINAAAKFLTRTGQMSIQRNSGKADSDGVFWIDLAFASAAVSEKKRLPIQKKAAKSIKWNTKVLKDGSKEYSIEGFEDKDSQGNTMSRIVKFTGRNSSSHGYYVFHKKDYYEVNSLKDAKIRLQSLLGASA